MPAALLKIYPEWWPCCCQMILEVYQQLQILCSTCNTGLHKKSPYYRLFPTAVCQPHNDGVCLNPAYFKRTIQLGHHLIAMPLHWSDLCPYKPLRSIMLYFWNGSSPHHTILFDFWFPTTLQEWSSQHQNSSWLINITCSWKYVNGISNIHKTTAKTAARWKTMNLLNNRSTS